MAVLAIAALAKRSLFWYTNDIIAIAAASGVFPAFQMRREGGRRVEKMIARMMESGTRLAFALLLIFAAISSFYNVWIAIGELLVVGTLYIYYRAKAKRRRADIRQTVETLMFQVDDASKNSLMNFPLPTAILRIDTGEVVWCNDGFFEITGAHERMFNMHITDVMDGFDTKWIMEGRPKCPYEVEVNGRHFEVYGNIVRSGGDAASALLTTMYWVDVTDYSALRAKYEQSRPVVAILVLDSYEELIKGVSEAEKSKLTAQVDEDIANWAEPVHGVLRRLDRDKYLFLFEQKDLAEFVEKKFDLLDKTREIKSSSGVGATISIGIGKGDTELSELYQYARLAADTALARGGDQVVIKSKYAFEFYGGQTKEVEKRTKVKSRVVANSLRQYIKDSSYVFIMGHQLSDLDAVGAAAGVCAAVRKCGKKPYFIVNSDRTSAKDLIDKLAALEEYKESFIKPDDAIFIADSNSLLIVVDTNRPDFVDYPEVLQTIQRVAVIDHHRRAASYIENYVISLHEPYASSTSELVTELLQYILTGPQELKKEEAEALLSGIFLDTKSFTVKTGVRTFEAAAYLRQCGADTVEVRRLFNNNFDSYIKKYQIISNAEQPYPGVSVSVFDEDTERATASQAADELINISDIKASFVVVREHGHDVAISGRSYGKMNVQVVLEKLGGGGSLTMAGAQFQDADVHEVAERLRAAIEEYLAASQNEAENVPV